MKNTDIEFNEDKGYWDLSLDTDGDFKKVNSFDSAILLSVFGSDRRASEAEQPDSARRRGWIGDINAPVEYGSKLWLLYQSRLTNNTVNRARGYLEQCLEWLVDFGYCRQIIVETRRDLLEGTLFARIQLIRFDDVVEHRNFVLWENTGN